MWRSTRRLGLGLLLTGQVWFIATTFRDQIIENRGDRYDETAFDYVLQTSFYAGAVIAALAGAVLWDRQPRNRCGPALIMLGMAMTAFYAWGMRLVDQIPPDTYVEHVLRMLGVSLLRPILLWLLLSWPTGRLSRRGNMLLVVYTAIHLASGFATQLLHGGSVLSVASIDWLAQLQYAFFFYTITIGLEIVVLVLIVRRFRAAPPAVRTLIFPVVVAAALMLIGDVSIPVTSVMSRWTMGDDGNQLTTVGAMAITADYLRFIAIPIILLVAAARRRSVRGDSLTVELGAVARPESLSLMLADSLGDRDARVLYPAGAGATGAGWVDGEGRPVDPRADRRLTLVQRNDVVVAAIDHGPVTRPASLEAAASTLGMLAEHQALEAVTSSRLRELRRIRADVLDAEDSIRRRLERDLHDGAQQQILALALQAQLTSSPTDDALVEQLQRVRDELLDIAEGVTERVIAERGLQSFLQALAATSPVPAQLVCAIPESLDAPAAAAAWFVASEAVGNAAKHSSAERLTVDVHQNGDALVVVVRDNGCGGADPAGGGLAGLARRLREIGGTLLVNSPIGAGTSLIASIPLGAVR